MKKIFIKIIQTILNILASRFQDNKEQYVLSRRRVCIECEYNSLNVKSINIYKLFIQKLSDLYSIITGNSDKDVLGNCTACQMCSIYYKTATKIEQCPKNKWNDSKEING